MAFTGLCCGLGTSSIFDEVKGCEVVFERGLGLGSNFDIMLIAAAFVRKTMVVLYKTIAQNPRMEISCRELFSSCV